MYITLVRILVHGCMFVHSLLLLELFSPPLLPWDEWIGTNGVPRAVSGVTRPQAYMSRPEIRFVVFW